MNEIRDALSNEGNALTMRVGSDRADFTIELFCTSNDIRGEQILARFHERGIFEQGGHLWRFRESDYEHKRIVTLSIKKIVPGDRM